MTYGKLKLFIFEKDVDDTIDDSKEIPYSLAEKGHIDISHGEISKLTGKVFLMVLAMIQN